MHQTCGTSLLLFSQSEQYCSLAIIYSIHLIFRGVFYRGFNMGFFFIEYRKSDPSIDEKQDFGLSVFTGENRLVCVWIFKRDCV